MLSARFMGSSITVRSMTLMVLILSSSLNLLILTNSGVSGAEVANLRKVENSKASEESGVKKETHMHDQTNSRDLEEATISRCPEGFDDHHHETKEQGIKMLHTIMAAAKHDSIIADAVYNVQDQLLGNLAAVGNKDLPKKLTKSEVKAAPAAKNYIVPVVFHMVINPAETDIRQSGKIPYEAILAQVNAMNESYSKHGDSGDSGIRFVLQAIYKYSNADWFKRCGGFGVSDAMKKKTTKPPERFLNIWTCDMGGVLGYVRVFPDEVSEKSPLNGLVINYKSFPDVNDPNYTPMNGFNKGFTITHEAGHSFGLYHTFQGGCSQPNDGVTDTPQEASPASGLVCQNPTPRDSCPNSPGVDPVTNYMDYAYDDCMSRFSPLQIARMRASIQKYKPTLAKNTPRSCVSNGVGTSPAWRMCESECMFTKTPTGTAAPATGWCQTSKTDSKQWGACCCFNGCTPSSKI